MIRYRDGGYGVGGLIYFVNKGATGNVILRYDLTGQHTKIWTGDRGITIHDYLFVRL